MYKETSNQALVRALNAKIMFDANKSLISLSGSWLWSAINEATLDIELNKVRGVKEVTIDGTSMEDVDTTGLYFIVQIINYLKKHHIILTKLELTPDDQKLYERIAAQVQNVDPQSLKKINPPFINLIGMSVFIFINAVLDLLSFFGRFCFNILRFLKAPQYLDWREVSRTINDAGVKGVLVASLLSFLIGITLAYQMAPQFVTYGANVYIVNFLGIALLKEVSPLLTAVIVAGRTGAAITAEIGTRKIQEEIDALQTMGISPMQRIVLPKVIGVMIAVPLITAIADMASMLGGAIVSNSLLSVNYDLFLFRMQNNVSIHNYSGGIIKSIAFAYIIGLVGCFCGLQVKGDANSIGQQTTKSVVTSIILIVFADAIFAIIFKIIGV